MLTRCQGAKYRLRVPTRVPRLRPVLTPGWVAGDIGVLALVVTMVLLGRWQLDVSNSKHFDIQNFGYALQWWAFSIFAIVMWVRVVRDALRRAAQAPVSLAAQQAEAAAAESQPVQYRRYVMPTDVQLGDPEHQAYNDYLRGLAESEQDGSTA
jgi:DNA-binding transcriptional regulator of glucitol operon